MTEHERFCYDHGYAQAKRDFRKVVEDIKAEINNSESDAYIEDEYGYIVDSAISFEKIMSIIDKHIGGKK